MVYREQWGSTMKELFCRTELQHQLDPLTISTQELLKIVTDKFCVICNINKIFRFESV